MKVYDFECQKCNLVVEMTVQSVDDGVCEKCGDKMTVLPCAPKNYQIYGDNSASTSPKQFKRLK